MPAFVADRHDLAHAVLGQHPFQRLPRDVVAVGAADAGRHDDFGVHRRDDAARRNASAPGPR